ncbi:MAG TPA: DUF4350 domain-containing protein [Flavisolibacter sp.]|nr:DUF4350 domain-containing protein [Flavisolibacter sp.]
MKKNLPYIIAVVLLVVLAVLLISNKKNAPRQFNDRISLRQRDKIPYGTSVAKSLLPSIFPGAKIFFDNKGPGNWDSLTTTSYNQALILVAADFNADESELNRLLSFVQQGNYVFIISRTFSAAARRTFNFTTYEHSFSDFVGGGNDSLSVKLDEPGALLHHFIVYPGKKYSSSFISLDTLRTKVLGRDEENYPDFIEMKSGNGRFFIHSAPLAFSNYFILHKQNVDYYEHAISMIPPNVERIAWSEYYLNKPSKKREDDEPNIFRVLFKYPAFIWGLLTGMFALVLFALLGSRRKQRKIPEYARPKNDSLDFVKTMGRLYHDRRDHQNLAKKMAVYFSEHVRSRYKIPTHTLDDNFIKTLHYKSGYPPEELSRIVSFINYLGLEQEVSEEQLSQFHRELEMFYQTT